VVVATNFQIKSKREPFKKRTKNKKKKQKKELGEHFPVATQWQNFARELQIFGSWR